MTLNTYDHVIDCCRTCESYPENYLRPGFLKRQLQHERKYLDTKSESLFDAENERLDFLELEDGSKKYKSKRIGHSLDLKSHLHADDSRAPLNCSRASFTYVLTFHQVAPSFLDYLHSFGDTENPLDYSWIDFQSEDSLGVAKSEALEIPKLGRSGRELRVSYLLRSVERSEDRHGDRQWAWKVRQMAVYHSFDLVNGRAFWLHIKANGYMKDTITDAVTEIPELRGTSLNDVASAFAATLATHTLILDWCDYNWRECINDAGDALRTIITRAKTTLDFEDWKKDPLARAATLKRSESNAFGPSKAKSSNNWLGRSLSTGLSKAMTNLREKWPRLDAALSTASTDPGKKLPALQLKNAATMLGRSRNDRDFQDDQEMFTFGDMQKLHHFGEQMQEMRLVIQLDVQALRDINETYRDLVERHELKQDLQHKGLAHVLIFSRKITRLVKSLEARLTQLETMITWISDGKALFDNVLHLRSVHASVTFAESAHRQGRKMERIANQAEQEAGSMHIITFVTLAFLPGTFVATFFQSGLVSLPDGEHQLDGGASKKVQLNEEAFKMFCKICFPLMALTFLFWFIAYYCLKARRSRRRQQEDEEEGQT
ncbi:hypothetical protein BGZ63DRAFT_421949 [Mariannaea sp. PMI_226]|nr:hypothetical protein BGZ63DRAFT_421949 [Mariannaea sp. PMI_226]